MFFSRRDVGRVYVIRLDLPDGAVVHKIGMTNSDRTVDRMMEILRSWFQGYRFVPYAELRLDMSTSYPKELEAHMHKILHHRRFIPNIKVDGGTEMFLNIDEFRVLHYLKTFNEDLVPMMELTSLEYDVLGRLISP
ncbi:MAG: hypothetical protein V3S69_00850 [Dehalococcoidales bacterium]